MRRRPDLPLSSNDRYVASMACFADIPPDQLSIHTGKYGFFGLALPKKALIPKAVRPVYYLPYGAGTGAFGHRPTVEKEWDEMALLIERHVMRLFGGHAGDATDDEQERIDDWLDFGVLAYVKFFDPSLPEDDPQNVYMEREWRSTSNVQFDLADVTALYVAQGFRDAVQAVFPGLGGDVVELPLT